MALCNINHKYSLFRAKRNADDEIPGGGVLGIMNGLGVWENMKLYTFSVKIIKLGEVRRTSLLGPKGEEDQYFFTSSRFPKTVLTPLPELSIIQGWH